MKKIKLLVVCIFGLVLFGSIGSGIMIEKETTRKIIKEPFNTGDILFSMINIKANDKLLEDSGGYKLFYIIIAKGQHDVSWNVEYNIWHGGEYDYGIHEGLCRSLAIGPILIGFGRANNYWTDFDIGSFQANLLYDGVIVNGDYGEDNNDDDNEFEVDAKGDYDANIGEEIEFEGYAKGGIEPYTWDWDFGDGNTSTEQFPTHYYLAEGEYDVSLTVTDANESTASDETRSRIENDFEADAGGDYDGYVGDLIQFEGKAEKGVEPYSWYWDFGDGNTSTAQNPEYSYDEVGEYTATLTVTDAVDNTASDDTIVYVEDEE